MNTGDKIIWTVGKVENKGVFLVENDNEVSEVISHYIGGQPAIRQVKVLTKLLIKKEW